ncbi:MAG: acyl-CoA dehydrogenase [Alphaproteobacteria bacterium]|nr:acyl-CoA dehydrogenase [Alphaproteobacteria bacterium]
MSFAFTQEQTMIADTARAFFAEHATSARTRAAMAGDGIDRDLWRGFAQELGFGAVGLAPEDGGLGAVAFAIVAEASGAHVAAAPILASLALSATAVAVGGSAAQKSGLLPRLTDGSAIAAFAEADGTGLTASAGGLSGCCPMVMHGAGASHFVAVDGDRAWIVGADAPGVLVEPLATLDQTRPFARVTFANAPAEPLPESSSGVEAARRAGWICLAAEALGGAQACLDHTVAYAKTRHQFGRPIGSFQAYKHRLADRMVDVEQARSAVYWAACAADEGAADTLFAAHAAKSFAADAFFRCAADMIQLHGGIGFTWEHDAHLYFKRARAIQTALGTGAWHRERIAQMIGLGASR